MFVRINSTHNEHNNIDSVFLERIANRRKLQRQSLEIMSKDVIHEHLFKSYMQL